MTAGVKHVKSFGLPTLVLGGGGYTIRNVSRLWAYETAVILEQENEISGDIPFNDYFQYFAPDYQLHLQQSNNVENKNTKEYLETVKTIDIDVYQR